MHKVSVERNANRALRLLFVQMVNALRIAIYRCTILPTLLPMIEYPYLANHVEHFEQDMENISPGGCIRACKRGTLECVSKNVLLGRKSGGGVRVCIKESVKRYVRKYRTNGPLSTTAPLTPDAKRKGVVWSSTH